MSQCKGVRGMTGGLIDVHQHFFSPGQKSRELHRAHGHLTPQERLQGWSPDQIVEQMDAHRIARAIGSISTPGVWNGSPTDSAHHAREWNEYAASLSVQYSGRFGFFAAIPLPATDVALAELAHSDYFLHSAGVSLFTNYDGRYLGDAAFIPVFEEINRRGCLVFVHPTAPAYGRPIPEVLPQVIEFAFETTRTILSLLISGNLRRYPDIRWIFSHTGGAISILADRIERLLMRPPYAEQNQDGIRPMLNRLHFDIAGTESVATIDALRALVPHSQIVFGSDMPFVNASKSVDTLARLDISSTEREAIAFANARRLLVSR
jgi:predicted TIM-barrel fold metal-dependent hydrolase